MKKYDLRDEEYVPEFDEGPEYGEDIDPEFQSNEREKFVIVGTTKWGKEIIDYADTAEEAEELKMTYEDSFGSEWEIDWFHEEDVDFGEDEFLEDNTYIDEEPEEGEEDWTDPAGGVHSKYDEDPAKAYESLKMPKFDAFKD